MMISDLSVDLVEEILSRVPAISLKQLRSTSKEWNALFKDERFAKKNFGNAAKQFLLVMLKENRVCSLSANIHEIHNNVVAAPSIEFKGGLKDSGNTSIYISKVFHCDGLLLCINNDYSIVVWNPILGETRWIQSKTVYKKITWFAIGYQNTKSSCRNYKILKCWFQCIPNKPIDTEFAIFELSSGSWRLLDVNPECIILSNGLSLKGNSYWVAFNCKPHKGLERRLLLNFDFSTEKFTCLCIPFQRIFADTITLSVFREEELLVLHQSFKTLTLDIWVTTNLDQTSTLSWSKFFAVDLYNHNSLLPRFVDFFIEEENKRAVCIGQRNEENIVYIIGEDGTYTELSLEKSTDKPMMRFVFNYVPSLVHIQQG